MPSAPVAARKASRSGRRSASAAVAKSEAQVRGGLLIQPDSSGPRIRLGVLWFLLALAAVTSGRLWISVLCAAISALAASQTVAVWNPPKESGTATVRDSQRGRGGQGDRSSQRGRGGQRSAGGINADRVLAAASGAALPLLAGYSVGALGLGLIAVPIAMIVIHTVRGGSFVTALPGLIGALVPAMATVPIVLVVRINLWAGLFLVIAVSMYDAGSFLHGADSDSRWEGPTAGIIGVLAVTFTMGVFHPTPLTPVFVAASGAFIAAACPLGQMFASRFLPYPDAKARGLRRLDAFLIAAPGFYIASLVFIA